MYEQTSTAAEILMKAVKVVSPSSVERLESLKDLADEVAGQVTDVRERERARRALPDQLEKSAHKIDAALEKIYGGRIKAIPEGEKAAVRHCAQKVMVNAEIDKRSVIQSGLSPEQMYQDLQDAFNECLNASAVSDKGKIYGSYYLSRACHFLVSLVRDLPDFAVLLSLESYLTTRQLVPLVERLVSR